MKNFITILFFSCRIAVSAFASDTPHPVKITIYHTSDFHECSDGLIRIAKFVQDKRSAGENILFVDTGDWFDKGDLSPLLTRGEAISEMIGASRYDAVVPGNHDYTYGLERLAELTRKYAIPLLAANWPSQSYPAYSIHEFDGVKVGIIGVATLIANYTHGVEMGLKPIEPAVQAVVAELDKQVDIIVVLTHSGSAADMKLAAAIPRIDIVFGGHNHRKYSGVVTNEASQTLVQHSGALGESLGEVTLTWDGENIVERTAKVLKVTPQMEPSKELMDIRSKYVDAATILPEVAVVAPINNTMVSSTTMVQSDKLASEPSIPFAEIKAKVITEPTRYDTDDPAIWIHPTTPSKSLVIGTDKNNDGALYVYDLEGKIVQRVGDLKRPNNVDVAYGFSLGGKLTDIAVTTERHENRLRVYTVPEMRCVDKGDLLVFDRDPKRQPMGIALYKRPRDGALFAIVGGKSGPKQGYLGQYRLEGDSAGQVKMTLVREFGNYSGRGEIEAIAVDEELGYVYYSDELYGIRKYHADPDVPNADQELAVFGTEGFMRDREGIAIYKADEGTGYIIISDQQAHQFRVFPREGYAENPHDHPLIKILKAQTQQTDGCEVTSISLPPLFPNGLLVAMSEGKTFHYYAWEDIAGNDLTKKPLPLRSLPEAAGLPTTTTPSVALRPQTRR